MSARIRRVGLAVVAAALVVGCRESTAASNSVGAAVWRIALVRDDAREHAWAGEPAFDAGRVFMLIGKSAAALDAGTGRTLWRTRFNWQLTPLAPNVVARGGAVYFGERDTIYALDGRTGVVRWRYVLPATRLSTYVEADERAVYVAPHAHSVAALHPGTGNVVWSADFAPGGWPYAWYANGFAYSGDTLYATTTRCETWNCYGSTGVVIAFDKRDGRELWRYETVGQFHEFYDRPTLAGRLLVMSDPEGDEYYAVDRFTGERVWAVPTERSFVGPDGRPAVRDGIVYVAANDTHVYASRLETGEVLWRTSVSVSAWSIAVCGDYLFVQRQGVAILDRRTGRLLKTVVRDDHDFISGGFAVGDGRVYAPGNLAIYAFDCG